MTVGPGSFLHELIELAGGENIARDADTPWPIFSEELVIERDPQVIILTCFNLEEALSRPSWQTTSAMRNGYVYEVNPDPYARTTQVLDALEELDRYFRRSFNHEQASAPLGRALLIVFAAAALPLRWVRCELT